jgi:hypothetical protein
MIASGIRCMIDTPRITAIWLIGMMKRCKQPSRVPGLDQQLARLQVEHQDLVEQLGEAQRQLERQLQCLRQLQQRGCSDANNTSSGYGEDA